jgi:hypothetical protein
VAVEEQHSSYLVKTTALTTLQVLAELPQFPITTNP